MARIVTGVIPDGSGLRVTFDDGSVHQFVWGFVDGVFILTEDGSCIDADILDEIIDKAQVCTKATSLWSHLFGVAGDHLSASAVGQIGDALTPNTWTVIEYDDLQIESHGTQSLEILPDGTIVIPRGEYYIDASILAHRSGSGGADGVVVSIQGWNVTTGLEIPFSFHQGTQPALNTAPLSLRTSFLFDTNGRNETKIQIRVQADTNRCSLGAESGKVPSGSSNHAGFVNAIRTG